MPLLSCTQDSCPWARLTDNVHEHEGHPPCCPDPIPPPLITTSPLTDNIHEHEGHVLM